jgi:predicted transcriptional regulator YdeE
MRTLLIVLTAIVCITTQGCNKNRQTAMETKTLPQLKYDIVDRNAFTVMGIQTRVTDAEQSSEKYTEIWKEFEPYIDQIRPISTGWRCYGVDFATNKEGVFDYLAGMAVQSNATPPDPNLVTRKVPAARYAVFKCPYQEIGQTYQDIFNNWLPDSRYEIDKSACSFEIYAMRGRESRPVVIHIPIKNK